MEQILHVLYALNLLQQCMFIQACPIPPVEASKTLLSCVYIHESLSYGYVVRLVARTLMSLWL